MSEELKAAVTAATLQVLKALARLLLESKIGIGEARALTKLAYVLGAHEQAQSQGGSAEPNVSRISTVTGLSRPEVTALLSQAPDEMPPVKRGRPRAQAVIDGWINDPRFGDQQTGQPAVLPLNRGRCSFRELVLLYSGDGAATYAPILNELLQAKAVALVGQGSVRLLKRTCANVRWSPETIASIDDVALHLQALVHNLQSPQSPQYVRSVRCEGLDAEEAKVVLPELQESAEDFIESSSVTLQQARGAMKSKRASLNAKRVSVLVQVLQENENLSRPKALVSSRDKKTSRPRSKAKRKPNSRGLI
jgi:Family of unknown function (DUF6502)